MRRPARPVAPPRVWRPHDVFTRAEPRPEMLAGEGRMTMQRKRIFQIAGAALTAIVLLSVLARGRAPRHDAAQTAALPVAPVVAARKTSLRTTLTLSGEFKPFQEVDLHAKVAGYIRSITVDVGDRVRPARSSPCSRSRSSWRSSRRPALRSTAPDRRTRRRTRPTPASSRSPKRVPGLIARAGARRRPRPRPGSRSPRRRVRSEPAKRPPP